MKSKALSILFGLAGVLLVYWVFLPAEDIRNPIYDESADATGRPRFSFPRLRVIWYASNMDQDTLSAFLKK